MKKKLKTICIIPARGGSKGLPGKNLKLFNGKPLIAWPIIAATNCENIDTVIVTTDSAEIAAQAKLYGASVPSLRPLDLAQDNSTTETTLKDALDKFEKLTNQYFDICVFLTCTDIFRDTNWDYKCCREIRKQYKTRLSFCCLQNSQKFLAQR